MVGALSFALSTFGPRGKALRSSSRSSPTVTVSSDPLIPDVRSTVRPPLPSAAFSIGLRSRHRTATLMLEPAASSPGPWLLPSCPSTLRDIDDAIRP